MLKKSRPWSLLKWKKLLKHTSLTQWKTQSWLFLLTSTMLNDKQRKMLVPSLDSMSWESSVNLLQLPSPTDLERKARMKEMFSFSTSVVALSMCLCFQSTRSSSRWKPQQATCISAEKTLTIKSWSFVSVNSKRRLGLTLETIQEHFEDLELNAKEPSESFLRRQRRLLK